MLKATEVSGLCCLLVGIILLAGCGGQNGRPKKASIEMEDQELYELGMAKMEKKKYLDARSIFRQLELRNPRGELAPLVKIAIADSYWFEGSLGTRAEAVAAYRSFLSFYPKHPKACHAQYRIARYHMKQMKSPERDQTETENSIAELQKLLVNYPGCEHAEEARQNLDKCFNRLADHNMVVAEYYNKLHKHESALGRYLYIAKNYYKYPKRDKALYRIISIYRRRSDDERAKEVMQQLLSEYPDSPYANELKRSGPDSRGDRK